MSLLPSRRKERIEKGESATATNKKNRPVLCSNTKPFSSASSVDDGVKTAYQTFHVGLSGYQEEAILKKLRLRKYAINLAKSNIFLKFSLIHANVCLGCLIRIRRCHYGTTKDRIFKPAVIYSQIRPLKNGFAAAQKYFSLPLYPHLDTAKINALRLFL
jgi:hypothetical protein